MRIRFPEGYDESDDLFTVVYVTDADWNFEIVADFLEYLSYDWKRYPDMIVVGIENVDRNRDFVPRADAGFPHSGEGDRFVTFTADEWIPHVERRVRGNGHRILVGHSFGGVNALNVLLSRPELFDAYIAIGSSTWVADRVLFDRAQAAFAAKRRFEAWLYMSVAEADGGETVPAGNEFAQLFEANAPKDLDWYYEVIPQTTHFSAVPPSLHNAFQRLFPSWGMDADLKGRILREGAGAVPVWFAEKRAELGFRFHPQDWDLMVLAFDLATSGEIAAALALLDELQKEFPRNPTLPGTAARIMARAGRKEEALASIDKAIALAQRIGYYKNQIISLERQREAIAAQ